jgi:hypothetical protein
VKILNNRILEVKLQLHQLTDKIKKYENNYNFIPNKISNESLLIGKIKQDIITKQDMVINFFKYKIILFLCDIYIYIIYIVI